MANNEIANLQRQFPDMTQSVVSDIFSTCGKDKNKAISMLRDLENENTEQRQKKIRELSELFPTVPKKDIEVIFDSCNGDVEAAILPLFNKSEEIRNEATRKEQEEAKKLREIEAKKKKQEEYKKKADHLMQIFQTIPIQKVQQILDENEGDIEETTNQLLTVVGQQEQDEEQKRKEANAAKEIAALEEKRMLEEQERRLRELKLQALREKFDNLSEQEVVTGLESNGWDIKRALSNLLKLSLDKKKTSLKQLFPTFQDDLIETTLQTHDWNVVKAAEALNEIRKQEESAATKKQAEPVLTPVSPNTAVNNTSNNNTTSTNTNTNVIKVTVKKVEQEILAKSVMIGQQLEDEIAASHIANNKIEKQVDKQAVAQMFKDDLEHIIATQARHNAVPGMAPPPLPKQIDAMLGKQRAPVDETPSPSESSVDQSKENPVKLPITENDLKTSAVKWNISLVATPASPDVGNPITLQWEILSNQTATSYDWIGLFPANQPNKQYVTYQWAGKDKKKGSLFFNAPTQYGEYEFRYFSNGSYQHSSISNRVKVGPQVQIAAAFLPHYLSASNNNSNSNSLNDKIAVNVNRISGNDYARAWIGMYEKNQTDNKQYISYEYVGKSIEVVFDAPVKPQEYEFRFFTNSYVDVARSNVIAIDGQDKINASIENGIVTVDLSIVTVDPTTNHVWIGLYFTSEADNRQWRRYKYVQERASKIQFKAPKTWGQYEARVFANKCYEPFVKSNAFHIGA